MNRGGSRSFPTMQLYCVITLMLLGIQPAHAYVDPGTGAMLLQMVGAVIAAGLFYFRSGWSRLRGWLSGTRRSDKS
jgi:hypothetical protein